MKNVGLVILMVGVAVCGLFGARNPESVDARTKAGGQVAMTSIAMGQAWTAVCAETEGLAGEENAEACQGLTGALPVAWQDMPIKETEDTVEASPSRLSSLEEAITKANAPKEGEEAVDLEPALTWIATWLEWRNGERDERPEWKEDVAGLLQPAGISQVEGVLMTTNPELSVVPAEGWLGSDEERLETFEQFAGRAQKAIEEAPEAFQSVFASYLTVYADNYEAKRREKSLQPPAVGQRLSDWFSLAGLPFLVGLVLIAGGGLIARRAVKEEATKSPETDDKSGGGPIDFGEAIQTAAEEADRLAKELSEAIGANGKADTSVADQVKKGIEELQLEIVEPVVEARDRVTLLYGLGGFAAIFGPFSSGERKLNRAWSALVDNHPPESADSLAAAAVDLEEAHKVVSGLIEERAQSEKSDQG